MFQFLQKTVFGGVQLIFIGNRSVRSLQRIRIGSDIGKHGYRLYLPTGFSLYSRI